MEAADLHQHLWPEAVLSVLERRREAPRAHRRGPEWVVEPLNAPSFAVDPRDHDPQRRVARLADAGLDRAVVGLSLPVAFETLDPEAAIAVADGWHETAARLPAELAWWGFVPARVALADQIALVHEAAVRGAAGLCVSAQRLADPGAADRALPVLAACAQAGLAVFVHPGPATDGTPTDQGWWSPATDYVAQQARAWHAFHAVVRPELAELRVVFALLAGLAPVGVDRTVERGGGALAGALDDPLCFYETSSYGPSALRATVGALGLGQLVYGSDHPVAPLRDRVAEAFGADLAEIVRRDGAAGALGSRWVPA